MMLADEVTTTTEVLSDRLKQLIDSIDPIVIPNALDTGDNWLETGKVGSPDEWKRIFWQGSATHEADWEVCIDAIDAVMQVHDDVRLVLLGYLPKCIIARANLPHWKERIEHVGFSKPETYFDMIHHVRADVAVAPLQPQSFNEAKSPIKWLEATLIGIPVVASDMEPYASVISDGASGALVPPDGDAWFAAIEAMLKVSVGERRAMVANARLDAADSFDIREVAKVWKSVLFPSDSR